MDNQALVDVIRPFVDLRLAFGASAQQVLSRRGEVIESLEELIPQIQSASWSSATASAGRCSNAGRSLIFDLRRQAAEAAELAEAARQIGPQALDGFRTLLSGSNGQDVVDALRSTASQAGLSLPPGLEDFLEQFAAEHSSGIPIAELLGEYQPPWSPDFARVIAWVAVLGRVRGLWAQVLIRFNQTLTAVESSEEAAPLDGLADQAGGQIEQVEAALRESMVALRQTAGGPPTDSAQQATQLARLVENHIPPLGMLQALLYAEARRLRREGQGGQSESIGRLALKAGFLMRKGITAFAASERLIASLTLNTDAAAAELLDSSDSRPFDVEVPHGRDVSIHRLHEEDDGQFVEIRGFVREIQMGRRPGGFMVSRARLFDPSSGAEALVTALVLHFQHMGITGGCYCGASGILRKASDFADGAPAVEIDRLSLAELSKASWEIAFLQTGRPWFEVWRNAHNLQWSLGPQRAAESSGVSGGALEFVFLPWIRGGE